MIRTGESRAASLQGSFSGGARSPEELCRSCTDVYPNLVMTGNPDAPNQLSWPFALCFSGSDENGIDRKAQEQAGQGLCS